MGAEPPAHVTDAGNVGVKAPLSLRVKACPAVGLAKPSVVFPVMVSVCIECVAGMVTVAPAVTALTAA